MNIVGLVIIQDYAQLAKDAVPFLPFQTVPKESSPSAHFPGFTKVKNVYITGHSDATISVWDMTCPFLIPVLFLKDQVEVSLDSFCNFSSSGMQILLKVCFAFVLFFLTE